MSLRRGADLPLMDGMHSRGRFLRDVIPTGVGSALALGGLVTILVGGSLLDFFKVDFWLGAWILTVALSIAAVEGTFRRWQRVVEVAEAGGAVPPALSDVLAALIADGEDLCVKVEDDPTWGVIHQKSTLPDWATAVVKVLDDETPELTLWFHQMESPSRRPTALPDGAKERFLAQFRWAIDRLADIKDIVLARGPRGHPDGQEKTKRLLLLDRCLQLMQEARLLQHQIPPGMPMVPGQLDPEQANIRIKDCAARLRSVLAEAVGAAKAEELVQNAAVDFQPTVREGIDPGKAEALVRQQRALQDALRLDELTVRP
jgi:hypothetical protein